MDGEETPPAVLQAMTTEHFVLQGALSANTGEVGTRASLYIFSLSSSLVALGFASRSPEVFVPLVAIVLPAVFILGVFTAIRLVDSNLEGIVFLNGIARIRHFYRTLGPPVPEQLSAEFGRWPENQTPPELQMGPFVGFLTTTASMVAFINSILAGVGVALLVGRLFLEKQTLFAWLIGAGFALMLMTLFLLYQKRRYDFIIE